MYLSIEPYRMVEFSPLFSPNRAAKYRDGPSFAVTPFRTIGSYVRVAIRCRAGRVACGNERHKATLSRDIYKMRNQNTTRAAVNTILGKGNKSFLAY